MVPVVFRVAALEGPCQLTGRERAVGMPLVPFLVIYSQRSMSQAASNLRFFDDHRLVEPHSGHSCSKCLNESSFRRQFDFHGKHKPGSEQSLTRNLIAGQLG